ncbi:MAG: magnesium/cobalt transporter CorA [Candidatus Omnitrophica bacterium]|nr:magnesium/cobalt transporter CorA [Candidatus Omnitrophota bacterium]
MLKFIKKLSKTAGLVPGTPVHIGEERRERPRITVIDYDPAQLEEKQALSVEECFPFKEKNTVTWINIDGIHQLDIIEKIGAAFDLHPLTIEDIANTEQRPKYEDLEHYIFIVLNMLSYEKGAGVKAEQVSFILGKNYVISFQEQEGDVFNEIRDRIRRNKGRVRKHGSDYLAYALIDAIVDNYYVILEKIGEEIEDMEEELISNPDPATLQIIHRLKQEIIFLRKSVWPLRETVSHLERGESKLVQKNTRVYLRDLYDHTIQVIDTVETFRDMVSGMLDIYLSSLSNKMNEVMKVLTMIATIFIPITFIAGLYGMNFNTAFPWNMPELNWKFGYVFTWGLMITVAATMVIFFKKKRWF